MNIIEKLGINNNYYGWVNSNELLELQQQRNEMLEALIDFNSDAKGYGVDTDPELVDLVESHLLIFTNIIEKATNMKWEEIIKI